MPVLKYQRGQAALISVLLLVSVGASALVYTMATRATTAVASNKKTAASLARARDALIGYAASNTNQPGVLPCPDNDNDGSADSPCGVTGATAIGKLPWKTLDLPDLRDGSGECLWYAVSANFKNSGVSGPSIVNSDSVGTLTVYDSGGAQLFNSDSVVAIVFAPGGVIDGQDRSPSGASTCGGNATASNYLDAYMVSGVPYNNATGSGTNSFIAAPFSGLSDQINDKLLPVTKNALMSVVEMRVLRTMRAALITYNTVGYPFANPYSDNINYECSYLQTEGRFPVKMNTLLPVPSGCLLFPNWGAELPAWFATNRWQTVSYYSVDPCKVRSVAGAGGTIVSELNALCDAGLPPKVDGTAKDFIVMVGSSALATVGGQTPRPCTSRSACFEAPNLAGNAFTTPTRSSTNNDRLTSVP